MPKLQMKLRLSLMHGHHVGRVHNYSATLVDSCNLAFLMITIYIISEFIESDVYSLEGVLEKASFDIVYTNLDINREQRGVHCGQARSQWKEEGRST